MDQLPHTGVDVGLLLAGLLLATLLIAVGLVRRYVGPRIPE
jgi:LPXTG-motif cell wall-anchored protein